MKIQEILNTTNHRPWPVSVDRWRFYQEWKNAVFLHWQVNIEELKKVVATEIEIDLFEGKPWISMVAFAMENIRPRNLPPFAPISNFDEINIRTYVKYNNKPGVYFLSMEGGKRLSCSVAKGISELPYRFSKIKRTTKQYSSSNNNYNDHLNIEFKIGKEFNQKSTLDKWLTERYALFQETKKAVNQFEVHHIEWPLHEIDLTKLKYNRFDKLINYHPDKIHYSPGVKVVSWGKIKHKKTK